MKGFTLIELLVTLGIVALLTAVGVPAFRQFGSRQELAQAADQAAATLREAQALALAPRSVAQPGTEDRYYVVFNNPTPGSYSLRFGRTGQADADTDQATLIREFRLPPDVTFQSFTPAAANRWTFRVVDQGRINGSENFEIRLVHARLPGLIKRVLGTPASGLIRVE